MNKSQTKEGRGFFYSLCLLCFLFSILCFTGCGRGREYPANQVPQSIEKICKEESEISVTARVVGKTAGALIVIDSLLDSTGQVPKEVHEQMGKVMQAVTRVALSTDLAIDFCVVSVRDRAQGNELSITRSVDDTRRANADALGIEESMNRTLFSQNKVPLTSVETFVLKEVTLENFLAEQIAQRIRLNYSHDTIADEASAKPFMLVDGNFVHSEKHRTFRFSILSLKSEDPKAMVMDMFKTAGFVLRDYDFKGFDGMEIQDYMNRQKLVVNRQTIFDYQNHKIKDEDILKKFLVESSSIQDAFKLFGFAAPQESSSPAAAPASTPSTS